MDNKVLRYEFEDYILLPSERLLYHAENPIPLKSKVFETLLTLVREHDKLLTKDQLMGQIWGSNFVEEGNLTQNIFTLRKIFGENPKDHRFIVTVPGQGYCFVAKVREITETAAANGTLLAKEISTNGHIRSVAVLPLKFLTPNEAEQKKYLGLAIADSVITQLGANQKFAVRSTETVLKYTESDKNALSIGRELAVDVVLSGTLQISFEKIRANVQLQDTSTGDTLWTNQFEAGEHDFFGLQDQISAQTAAALRLGKNHSQTTQKTAVSSEIYQKYLKYRFFWETRTEEGLLKSLAGAKEIVAAAPDFALGYVSLADSYLLLGHHLFFPPERVYPAVKSAVDKALALDPQLAEAHATMADYCFITKNWEQAEKFHKISMNLKPDYASARHWYSWFLMAMGRFDESLVQIEEAQRLDTNSLYLSTIRGVPLCYKGDFEQAIEQFRLVLDVEPNYKRAHYYLAWALFHAGNHEAGIAEFEKVVAAEPIQQTFGLLGYCYGMVGERKKALEILEHFDKIVTQKYISPYNRAAIYNGLGDQDRTFAELEKALAENSIWLVWLAVDYIFRNLHSEPRFTELLEKLNFPQANHLQNIK